MNPSLPFDVDKADARQILDSFADGVYITDANRKILFWSRAAARITGWSAEEVVGRTCFDNLLVHADKDGHRLCGEEHCPLHRAIKTGQESQEPLLVFAQHKLGNRIPVEVAVSPILDANHTIIGGIEVFRDVSVLIEDLRRAQLIQRNALGPALPQDPRLDFQVRYTPAELVGGDFYRVEPVGQGRYAILVADVMGHGLASALYTMQIRSLWEEERQFLGAPGELLARFNRHLRELAGSFGYFATAIMLVVDAATGALRVARAGHPAPFLRRKDGTFERLSASGPALGFRPDAAYREKEAHLEPGDAVLCLTDGALEIVDADGNELGEAGLQRLFGELDFGKQTIDLGVLERRLLEHSNAIHLPDDLTLLSIRRLS
ncbi:MAG: SpoIIE family protein phosphatase [Verrucomicrobiia bacterium]